MWPFKQQGVETRSSYTDIVVDALVAAAAGSDRASVQATAALESCSGWWSRALATARVSPQTPATMAVQPHVLAAIGRGLCRGGDVLFMLEIDGGRLRAAQVGAWTVRGRPDPTSWSYQCHLVGPDATEVVTVPAAGVLHCRYAVDPMEPWRGLGPLQFARETGRLAGSAEQALADEAGGPRGSLIPVAEGPGGGDDDESPGIRALKALLPKLRGRIALPETQAGGGGQGAGAAPHRDWRPERLGASPPEPLVALRSDVGAAVAAACGIGPSLIQAAADGTGQRESYRRFLFSTLLPIARIIEGELRDKLDEPDLTLTFDELRAADLTGRARAYRSMVGKEAADIDPARAAALAGLD